ncbi:hypothetical protein DRE_06306 [Drechslerella stenobrocha 248]|uniref:CID domain-containing protein n=1 Tax=Drechslerella stenobrocha 248 TaxID=1043628 RepID=W7HM13_9PEZI|nr:hypothetical protein DRE_06306 [Drechslerella stenobrocha 248]
MSFNDEVPSPEELAEDYRSSLEDLSVNSRWEITNLTVIAKENIHAAQAISKVIEEHIQKTSPLRKLPALYLLDSIAKNVGTPYTLFFGRNLYRTFMDAYSLVESPVRRKLEEMLQTWKQPVPGSTSSNPLFPADTTRKIDNALIKARTAAVQQQQKQMKQDSARFGLGQPSVAANANSGPYRSTPTPPTLANGHSQPGVYTPPSAQNFDSRSDQLGNRGTPQPTIQDTTSVTNISNNNYQQLAAHLGLASSSLIGIAPTADALLNDIRPLITTTQSRFAENPWDTEVQKRLKALLDLQTILSTQQLPSDQLSQIKDQLSRIAISVHVPPIVSQPSHAANTPAAPAPLSTAGQGTNLAALLNTFSKPQMQPARANSSLPTILNIPTIAPGGGSAPIAPKNLFESLISSGLLKPGGPAPQHISGTKPSGLLNADLLLSGLMGPQIPSVIRTGAGSGINWETLDIELTSASLKLTRPIFPSILNDSLPNKCGSCARRFTNTEQGKREKAAHLDWHFRVHQRIADSTKHAQFRSWYIGEEDWIKFREDEEYSNATNINQTAQALEKHLAAATEEASSQNFVPVPNDPALSNITCPVCKEKFATVLHPETEDWVLMDAIKSGGRIYHASCLAEISKDNPSTSAAISRGSTPDNSTASKGKRKADDLASVTNKIKKEK